MSGSVALDVLLALLLLTYAAAGLRQGFVVSVLSLAGFLGGGAVAMWLLPAAFDRWPVLGETTLRRSVVVIAAVFVLASVGQAITVALGHRIRSGVRVRPARALDSLLGMVVVVVATAVLIWFVAGAVRGGSPPGIARAIGQSKVLSVIDQVVPPATRGLFSGFRAALDREGFPRVFDGIRSEPIKPITAPDGSVVTMPAVDAEARSVVKITGVSQACQQGQEGSGWVVSKDRVVTNAHVVAGLGAVTVRPQGTGRGYQGRVVLFDPRRDLAVIDVPDLPSKPIPLGVDLARGASAAVAGFPLNGPYDVEAARVRQVLNASGGDIYGNPGTRRQIYSLYATIRPGNSGGPLLDPSGRVVGVVFAKSLDDPSTGYALTLAEARPVLDRAATVRVPVSTGNCVAE